MYAPSRINPPACAAWVWESRILATGVLSGWPCSRPVTHRGMGKYWCAEHAAELPLAEVEAMQEGHDGNT